MRSLLSAVRLRRIRVLPNPPPAPHAESLSGVIERVTFFNEENGWAVLKVKAKGCHDLVAVVGSLASVSAGEWVTAEGRWVQDKESGLQFLADMLNRTQRAFIAESNWMASRRWRLYPSQKLARR